MWQYASRPGVLRSVLLMLIMLSVPANAADNTTEGQATPALPRVLIIGDSISQGYHKTVVKALEGKADVSRIPGNGQWAGTGVKKIDDWLGETKWDVIHFNFGLWDMYGWEFDEEDRSPKAYEQRLETIVTRLKKTGAKLIWATTTPACPEAEVTMLKRFHKEVVISAELEQQYLDAAARVMKKHGVQVNDLHALVKPELDELLVAPDNVHYTARGYALLGKQVAQTIAATLADAQAQPADKAIAPARPRPDAQTPATR